MLRITRHDRSSSRVTLRLEGWLVAAWTAVLEHECSDLRASGLGVDIDLSGVGVVDRAGLTLLERLQRQGVEISGGSDIIASILENEGIPVRRRPGRRRPTGA